MTETLYVSIVSVKYPENYAMDYHLQRYSRIQRHRAVITDDDLVLDEVNGEISFKEKEKTITDEINLLEDSQPEEEEEDEPDYGEAQEEDLSKEKMIIVRPFKVPRNVVVNCFVYRHKTSSDTKEYYRLNSYTKTHSISGVFTNIEPCYIYRVLVKKSTKPYKDYDAVTPPERVFSMGVPVDWISTIYQNQIYSDSKGTAIRDNVNALKRGAALRPVQPYDCVPKDMNTDGTVKDYDKNKRILRVTEKEINALEMSMVSLETIIYSAPFVFEKMQYVVSQFNGCFVVNEKQVFHHMIMEDVQLLVERIVNNPASFALSNVCKAAGVMPLTFSQYATYAQNMNKKLKDVSRRTIVPIPDNEYDEYNFDHVLSREITEHGKEIVPKRMIYRCYLYAWILVSCIKKPISQLEGNSYFSIDDMMRMFYYTVLQEPKHSSILPEILKVKASIFGEKDKRTYMYPTFLEVYAINPLICNNLIKALLFMEYNKAITLCSSLPQIIDNLKQCNAGTTDEQFIFSLENIDKIRVYSNKNQRYENHITEFIQKHTIISQDEEDCTADINDTTRLVPVDGWRDILSPLIVNPEQGIVKLNQEQRDVVEHIVLGGPESFITCVIGGAGVGKTTTIRAAIQCFGPKIKVVVCTMCGRLSERHSQIIKGLDCKIVTRTIDSISSLVQRAPASKTAQFILEADIWVIDEGQNLEDMRLSKGFKVIDICKKVKKVIIIGDPKQIDPIGIGKPFTAINNSGRVKVYKLTETNRGKTSGTDGVQTIRNAILMNSTIMGHKLLADACTKNMHHLFRSDKTPAKTGARNIPTAVQDFADEDSETIDHSLNDLNNRLKACTMDSTFRPSQYMLWGESLNVELKTHPSNAVIIQNIVDIFKANKQMYRDIVITCRARKLRDALNEGLYTPLQNIVLSQERWKRGLNFVKLSYGTKVGIGDRICFRNSNYSSREISIRTSMQNRALVIKNIAIMNKSRDKNSKSSEGMEDIGHMDGFMPDYGNEDSDDPNTVTIRSDAVCNGQSDWIEGIYPIASGVTMCLLAQSRKLICISAQHHIDPNDVSLGNVVTIHSQMGSESKISIAILDYSTDITCMNRGILNVALTRATQKLYIMATEIKTSVHKVLNLLAAREIRNDRPPNVFFSLRRLVHDIEMKLSTRDIIDIIYTNNQKPHLSELEKIMVAMSDTELFSMCDRIIPAIDYSKKKPETFTEDIILPGGYASQLCVNYGRHFLEGEGCITNITVKPYSKDYMDMKPWTNGGSVIVDNRVTEACDTMDICNDEDEYDPKRIRLY